jgi:DHA2 family multidrug resistance protein
MEGTSSSHVAISGSLFFVTLAAMLASLMAVLDISIVNVAVNDIRASFGVQLDQIAWISTGYMMANVIVIPLTGWFQKKFGIKHYFIFSVFLFTVASLLCGASWNLASLTLFRILQGMGGGAIIPTASTLLMSRYPAHQQGMAQAFIGLGAMTGPLLGPTLGGYLIEVSSWHMIFLINIPVGIVSIYLAYYHIKEVNFTPHAPRFDKIGLLLLALGLGSLQFVLEEGNRHDWLRDKVILAASIISAVCLLTLVFQQMESPQPMIDFKVFANRNYFLCSFVNFLLGVALFSASFLYSLFCGVVLNYSPLDIGLLFLKGCFIQILIMPMVGKLVTIVDGRLLAFVGISLVTASIYYNSHFTQMATNHDLIFVLFLRSLGLGFVFIPLSVIAVAQISKKDLGNAVGLFNLTRELGGSIGLAMMSTSLINQIQVYGTYLRSYFHTGSPILEHQLNFLKHYFYGQVYRADRAAQIQLQHRLDQQATVLSFNHCFFVLSLIFLSSIVVLLLLKQVSKKQMNSVSLENMH